MSGFASQGRAARLGRRAPAIAAVALLLAGVAGWAAGTGAGAPTAKDSLIVLQPDVAPDLDGDGGGGDHPGTWEIWRNAYEPLLGYPATLRGKVLVPKYGVTPQQFEPRLAVSWTKKGLAWTFKLRKGVKSCTGNELTADDVVYTFARAKSVSGKAPVGWFLANIGGVMGLEPVLPKATPADKLLKGEVRKIDTYTVEIKQFHPNELFPRVLEIFALGIYDAKEMRKRATAADPWAHAFAATQGTAGFGAYCLTRWSKGSEMILTANPSYYRGQPQFKQVTIRKVPSDANRIAAVRAGVADIATNLTQNEYASLRGDPKVDVLGWFNNQTLNLLLNFSIPPWSLAGNRELRQAIAHALPYDDIIEDDYLGNARRWYGPGLTPSTYYGYVPIKTYTADPAKAKALLGKAGYPGGKGLDKQRSGLQLFYPVERGATLEPVANRVRTALAAIGIPTTLSPISQREFSDRWFTKKDLPMALIDFGAAFGPDVGYAMVLWYASPEAGGINNGQNYKNPAFDKLAVKSGKTIGAKRLQVLRQMQQIVMRDLPMLPVVEFKSQIAVRKGLSNWLVTSDNILAYWYFRSAS